jgi:hypothetical protein
MGREVRRVPKDWEHPMNESGAFVPLLSAEDFEVRTRKRIQRNEPLPDPADYMPRWTPTEATHYQMYETCTEGTPISPVFETPETLARWLADNEASAFGSMTASYEAWLRVCRGSSAPSAIMTGGGMVSGVEAMNELKKKGTNA